MSCAPKNLIILSLLIATSAWAVAPQTPDTVAKLRFASFAVTDHSPTVAEARALAKGDVTVAQLVDQWLDSDNHRERIQRYFHDQFGFARDIPLYEEISVLLPDDDGVYQLEALEPCDPAMAVQAEAWWLDEGKTILMCPEANNELMCFQYGEFEFGSCGCGPKQIACAPASVLPRLSADITSEFSHRAVHAYADDWSWFELLGGDTFYGNRPMFHFYLYNQTIAALAELPTEEDWQRMAALPMSGWAEGEYPEGPERAGVVTSHAFLFRFNNFRSRVRALTEKLLCKDVDGTLNTSNLSEFINEDHDELTLSHSDELQCAECHYGMDNIGSALFGWDDGGFFSEPERSQVGHVFGETGSGPSFVIEGYIERGGGFEACMARTAWEDFTGESWKVLDDATAAVLVKAAASGPRAAILAVLTSPALLSLRD